MSYIELYYIQHGKPRNDIYSTDKHKYSLRLIDVFGKLDLNHWNYYLYHL